MGKEKNIGKGKATFGIPKDFYKDKGYPKSFLFHMSEKMHEDLRTLAFKSRVSMQETLRAILEEKINKG
jgi:hypothetical protein